MKINNYTPLVNLLKLNLIVFIILFIIFILLSPSVISGLIAGMLIGLLNFAGLTILIQSLLKRFAESDKSVKSPINNFFQLSAIKLIIIGALSYLCLIVIKVNIFGLFLGIFAVLLTIISQGIKTNKPVNSLTH